jgi:DeoR family transcriptional regulator, suf operon transcriptional repressor
MSKGGTGKGATFERRHGETRREILEALRRSAGLTADQLADTLGVTAMAIRKHLAALQSQGVLTAQIERRPIGRPVYIYALAPTARDLFPPQYQELTTDLIDDLRAIDGGKKVALLFERRAERLYEQLAPAVADRPLPERLAVLADYLDCQGYLAEWESTPEGDYLLKEHNCAIYGVAQCAPEVCACELDLFRRLLDDADIEREQRVIDGDHLCCYRLKPKAS